MKKVLVVLFMFFSVSTFAQQKTGTVYMVSNAHFDTQWNWTVQTSINEYLRNTINQNLKLFEMYPDYVFNFEGGVKYNWMKEYYPFQYEKVKEYIKQGRWHISGASWDATDPNMPSPESFFRNILLGQLFYKDEFGVKSTDIFLPDCFGFGYTLPTVAAHCGLIGFSTQKLQWRANPFYGNAKVPFTIGLWQGIDGSRIAAALDARNYTAKYKDDVSKDKEIKELVAASPNKKGYRYYGTGDIGGSPTILSVESVQTAVNGKGEGPVNVVSASSDQLFKEYLPFSAHPELPVFDGELLMDVHATGCYTSQSAMKLFNRRNEQLAIAAESASVIADWTGGAIYPSNKISDAWKRFIWHQFHDDLTGTSIPQAYTFSWNDELLSQTQFNDIIAHASASVGRTLDTRTKGIPVVVFNSLAIPREEIVHLFVPMASEPKGIAVYSPKGNRVKAQLVSYSEGRAELAFAASTEPMSYSVYDLRISSGSLNTSLKVGKDWIENSIYKVKLDRNGDISSIYDKVNRKELVESGKSVRLSLLTENMSVSWPAWEITKKSVDSNPLSISDDVKISIVDKGPALASLKVERRFGESKFVQIISLTEGGCDERIDIKTDIDWKQSNALLKAEFPLSVSNPQAVYDLGLGFIKRGNNTVTAYEVYAHQWADITAADNSYGVSVVNNCKYGWDKPADNVIRLTLLHTPGTTDRYTYQNKQDFGHHSVTYSIIGHKADPVSAGIARLSDGQNNPLFAFISDKHAGYNGKIFSMLKVDSGNIDVKAFKKAENSDEYIVRIYERSGKGVNKATVEFAADIVSASELNGIEEVIGSAEFDGNKLYVTTTSFKPKTFSVKLSKGTKSIAPLPAEKINLDYNAQAYTSDAFRDIADIDGKGSSYSYDLLPEVLSVEGVGFKFGTIGRNNILRCEGKSIVLPESEKPRTLYILAASSSHDKDVLFKVQGTGVKCSVPYFSGFIGQWGWQGNGYLKNTSVAYVGTHRHNKVYGNEPYLFTYMFKIALPIPAGCKEVELPSDKDIMIFAASVSDEKCGSFTVATENVTVPK
ncbi:MAG: glycosyl hydrolase-related protein [Bacteroidales bacterium]|nr:glycosyl hydrolase-related protein [Bacteroidales bacterium]